MSYEPQYTITNSILSNIVKAEIAREIISNSPLVPYWERKFQNQALIRTVHHSTALEGNKLTIDEAENIVKDEVSDTPRIRDAKEIVNYRKAIGFVSGSVEKRLTISLLMSVHELLGDDLLPNHYLGVIRRKNAVIMSSLTGDVVFDPPPASEVKQELEDLVRWENINSEKVHPLIKAGILHYEIVRIHPFADLNGRTARLTATWSLYRDGFDINKYFSLEEYYDQNPKAYYRALDSANDGDLTEWLEYFSHGLADELERVKSQVIKISKDRRFKTKIGQIALNDRQIKIIDLIEEIGEFNNPDFAKYFPSISDDTILRDIKDLIEKKVIMKRGKTKGAKYIMA